MRIIISEEQKKKLFIPRKQSGSDSKWNEWNKDQPIKDGKPINQYDINTGLKTGYWEINEVVTRVNRLVRYGNYVDGKRDGIWHWYISDRGKVIKKGVMKYNKGEIIKK